MPLIPEEPPDVDTGPGRCVKRLERLAKVESGRLVGKRGGVREPLAIVWRACGTGLFRLVEKTSGKTVLVPWVRYRNGNGTVRACHAADWHDWAASLRPATT